MQYATGLNKVTQVSSVKNRIVSIASPLRALIIKKPTQYAPHRLSCLKQPPLSDS